MKRNKGSRITTIGLAAFVIRGGLGFSSRLVGFLCRSSNRGRLIAILVEKIKDVVGECWHDDRWVGYNDGWPRIEDGWMWMGSKGCRKREGLLPVRIAELDFAPHAHSLTHYTYTLHHIIRIPRSLTYTHTLSFFITIPCKIIIIV